MYILDGDRDRDRRVEVEIKCVSLRFTRPVSSIFRYEATRRLREAYASAEPVSLCARPVKPSALRRVIGKPRNSRLMLIALTVARRWWTGPT